MPRATPRPDTAPSAPLHLRPLPVLLVFVGGAAGTFARYAAELFGTPWALPLPTLGVNVIGAFLLGLLLEGLLRRGPDLGWRQHVRLLLGPGFLGGFTTYSTFAVETALLSAQGRYVTGFGYAIVSLVLGVAAAAAGVWVAANVFTVPRVPPVSPVSPVSPVPPEPRPALDTTQTLHLAQHEGQAAEGAQTPEEEAEG